jgi:mono/diheme cytochrome c family protein
MPPDVPADVAPGEGMPSDELPMLSTAVQIYVELCGRCHGEQGEGVDNLGPGIQHPVREFGDYLVRNGIEHDAYEEPMPAVAEGILSQDLLDEIWDYLDEQPRPSDGAGLFADFCRNCHGADGDAVPNHGISDVASDEYLENVRGGHPRQ